MIPESSPPALSSAASGAAERSLSALWHAAGRAAADPRKRLLALGGVAWSGPALLVCSFLVGLVTLPARSQPLTRPVGYVLEPLRAAYLEDRDGALLLYLVVAAALLSLVWGYFGGALSRLAAVDLTGRGREAGRTALAYVRRHRRALLGAPLLLLVACLGPLGLAWLVSRSTVLPGVLGDVVTPLAILGVVALSLLTLFTSTLTLVGGFVARAAVAADGADLFDAVSRPFTYALSGLPRLVGLRLWFAGGVLLGSLWRLARVLLAALLVALLLESALGPDRWRRVTAVLGELGRPADAERLGIGAGDLAAAGTLALVAAILAMLWLADLASRLACARMAVFLWLRRAVDRVPLDRLESPPSAPRPLTAQEAGFTEVARVDPS